MQAERTLSCPRVYLAGPDVFERDPLEVAHWKKAACAAYGLEGVFPLDADLDLSDLGLHEQARVISQANEALIRQCDALLANMTPFRGPSMDVGTAFEMGFARALGLPIVGYTDNSEKLRERTVSFLGEANLRASGLGRWEDAQGWALEDFDCVDNLMLDGAAVVSGGLVVQPRVGEEAAAVFARAVQHLALLLGD